jgi:putative endonuclease
MYVYMLASKPQGTLYVGVTNDLIRRVAEHKDGQIPGFTKRYNTTKLVYWEEFGDPADAILREKKLKKWRRDWKRALIEENNPHWADLFGNIAPGFAVGPGSSLTGRPG